MILPVLTMAAALSAAAPSDRPAACTAARAVYDALKGVQLSDDPKRPTVVAPDPPTDAIELTVGINRASKSPDPDGFLRHGWTEAPLSRTDAVPLKQPPKPDLITRVQQRAPVAALGACASFRSYLTKHHVRYGRAAVSAATGAGKEIYDVEVLRLSLPVVSRDGTEAIAIEETAASDVEGGVYGVLLRRQPGGAWIVVGSLDVSLP